MLLDLRDQRANLGRHGMLRRLIEKDVQSLNSSLILTQVYQRLSEDELGRAWHCSCPW